MTLPRTLLVVADDEEEMLVALRYAAMRARAIDGCVAILRVYEKPEMQLWRGVETTISDQQHRKAEARLLELAGLGQTLSGKPVVFYSAEGELLEELVRTIKEDTSISALVLAAAKGRKGPGRIINYLSGKGIADLPIPLVIVPEDYLNSPRADKNE